MKNLKTFEGFFDFFKKKHKPDPVSLEDIRDCLFDITDETRILDPIEDESEIKIMTFVPSSMIFGRKSQEEEHEDLMDDELGVNDNSYGFEIKRNVILLKIGYNPNEISDKEVGDILDNCKHSLESFDCKVTYFLAIDYAGSGGGYSDKEWTNFNDMIKGVSVKRGRNITIKIVALGGIKR